MNPGLRVVTKLPLRDLWDGKGASLGGRMRHLGQDRVRQLLREGSLRFVVADCGLPLNGFPHQTDSPSGTQSGPKSPNRRNRYTLTSFHKMSPMSRPNGKDTTASM